MQLHPCTIPDIQGGSIPRHNLPKLARCRVESKANGVFLLIIPRTVYMTTALPIPVSCILLPCSLKLSPLIDRQPVHTQYETRPRAASFTQGSLPDLCPSIHDLKLLYYQAHDLQIQWVRLTICTVALAILHLSKAPSNPAPQLDTIERMQRSGVRVQYCSNRKMFN